MDSEKTVWMDVYKRIEYIYCQYFRLNTNNYSSSLIVNIFYVAKMSTQELYT